MRSSQKHYWPGADAVGKHIRLDSVSVRSVEIVGVAQTIKYQKHFPADGFRVYAAGPTSYRANDLDVAVERHPLQLVQSVKDVVRALDQTTDVAHHAYEDFYLNQAVTGHELR